MNIEELSGVGMKRKAALNGSGIFTCKDILNHFPNKYLDLSTLEGFAADGKNRLIKVTLTEEAKVIRIRGGLNYTSAKVVDTENNKFTCVWFNQPYMKAKLKAFEDYFVYGKNSPTKKNNFVVQMMIKHLSSGVLGLYKTFDGIGQTTIKNMITESMAKTNIFSYLDGIENMTLSDAYKGLHFPKSVEEINLAKERVEIEKAIMLVGATNAAKNRTRKTQRYSNLDEIYTEFCTKLPFRLTYSQDKAILDLIQDFSSEYTSNRVIDGDVGSGKTMVAFFAMYVASMNGLTSAMLAPTELLAVQHYKNAKKIFGDKAILLTSSIKGADRKDVLNRIKNEDGLAVFGTHSIISDKVEYKSLGLAVVDEQHRFGVSERAKLANKGESPDIISMSATPIPRTLSLVLRGDADISEIKERPFAAKVQTNLVNQSREEDMWKFIDEKISSGSKVFVVCSKIGDDEDADILEYSATNMYKKLKSKLSHTVGLLTGKLSAENKIVTLASFEKGDTKVIVSTTIVEVGIDIPDSDIMVIATPERFGLSTLHQLRGRVGRDGQQAYCFCLTNNVNEKSYGRLKYFANTTDGFALADFDYENRGEGDIFGTKQHGKSSGVLRTVSFSAFMRAKNLLNAIKNKDEDLYDKITNDAKKAYDKIFTNVILN